MNFLEQPYHSNRYCVTAAHGMVATANSTAAEAGYRILRKGGNAVDAAVATAAALTVAEPVSNGIGSDTFAIVWMKDSGIHGVNASGWSPERASIEEIKRKGYSSIPASGFLPVTVPGTPKAWASLVNKWGRLSLKEDLEPAIRISEEGYAVSPALSFLWDKYVKKHKNEYQGNSEFNEWFRVFTKDGEPYQFGDIFRSPEIANGLKIIAETNAEAFYNGEIADEFIRESNQYGGLFTSKDLSEYDVDYVDPISINYRGYDIWELPPNGQGLIALMALNILRQFSFNEHDSAETYHKQFESMKIAFHDGLSFITDPKNIADYQKYLTDEYGISRAMQINEKASCIHSNITKSGTVYLCTADSEGNMVSYIQSNYRDFGSGIVLGKYGISLQNRGVDFSLDPDNINCLMPRKRSYHTIIPGFITQNGNPIGAFGVMGGYMQPQGHVQVITNMLDFGCNPQMAIDAPRWQWRPDGSFAVEPEFNKVIIEELERKGHRIVIASNRFSFGRSEIIWRMKNGVYVGACESRSDAAVYGW